jgi:hypothetical protein
VRRLKGGVTVLVFCIQIHFFILTHLEAVPKLFDFAVLSREKALQLTREAIGVRVRVR